MKVKIIVIYFSKEYNLYEPQFKFLTINIIITILFVVWAISHP